jgi:hypothetical protein
LKFKDEEKVPCRADVILLNLAKDERPNADFQYEISVTLPVISVASAESMIFAKDDKIPTVEPSYQGNVNIQNQES